MGPSALAAVLLKTGVGPPIKSDSTNSRSSLSRGSYISDIHFHDSIENLSSRPEIEAALETSTFWATNLNLIADEVPIK